MGALTKNPLGFVPETINSGHPRTGEMTMTQGGGKVFSAFSGGPIQLNSGTSVPVTSSGDHAVIVSGAGRLNKAFLFPGGQALSGVAITFYDANTPGASGPNTINNRPILGIVNTPGGVSGQIYIAGAPTLFEAPFVNGLAVNCPSGAPGFTVSYTQEVTKAIP